MKHPIESPRRRLAAKLLAAAVAVRRAGAAPTRVALPSLLAVAAAFALLLTAAAQQPDKLRLDLPDSLSLRLHGLDTLPLPAGDLRMQAPPVSWRPPLIEPLFPSIRIDRSGRPTRIYVINNIILQVGGYVNVTNGQAWIWSPYPNCYLDARTLSFPMPR